MKKIILIALLFTGTSDGSFAQCSTEVREAFGGTSSIALYNTYVTIGAIADGFVSDSYDGERVQSLMDEQTAMIGVLIDLLSSAVSDPSESLDPADKIYLKDMIKCLGYLKEEAQGLHDIAVDGSDDANSRYNTNRDLAWDYIAELLGLNEE